MKGFNKDGMQEFECRRVDFLRCGNPIFRQNIGDLIDYPWCEECQEKDEDRHGITRLDDGRHT